MNRALQLNYDPDDPGTPMWSTTKLDCSSCGERLSYTEEVYSLSVVGAQVTESGLIYIPLMVENDHMYEPLFFCFGCWEQDKESLQELAEDQPPIEDDYAVLECDICGSGIREGELLGVSVFGEIHLSKRSPNGEKNSDTFEGMDPNPDAMCVVCLQRLGGDVIDELWDGGIYQHLECPEGTFARCWRHGCSADGSCTFEETE
jgi:hypothetical protein